MTDIERLSALLRYARCAVAFTGAGMSTESGISDFRSPGGVWSRHQPVYYEDFVASRAARVRYWVQRRALYAEFSGARPNAGHLALARLEVQGLPSRRAREFGRWARRSVRSRSSPGCPRR